MLTLFNALFSFELFLEPSLTLYDVTALGIQGSLANLTVAWADREGRNLDQYWSPRVWVPDRSVVVY